MELSRDDLRPLTEKSLTHMQAPHAGNCDVGIADEPWTPSPAWSSIFNKVDAVSALLCNKLSNCLILCGVEHEHVI